MKTSHTNNSNQSTTNASWLWNYGKQAVKGLSVMSLGVLGYMGLRGYWRSDNSITLTNSESTDLVAATDTSTTVIKKDLANTPISTPQNIWNSAEQSLQYRRKRGVVPVTSPLQVLPMAMAFQLNKLTVNDQTSPVIIPNNEGGFSARWIGISDGSREGIFGNEYGPTAVSQHSIEYILNSIIDGAQIQLVATSVPGGNLNLWGHNPAYLNSRIEGGVFNISGTRVTGNGDYQFSFDPGDESQTPAVGTAMLNSTTTAVFVNWFNVLMQGINGQMYNYNNATKSLSPRTSFFTIASGLSVSSITFDQEADTFVTAYFGGKCFVSRLAINGSLVKNLAPISGPAGNQLFPYLLPRPFGGYQGFWIADPPSVGGDSSGYSIVTNIFDSDDQPLLTQPIRVNNYTIGDQKFVQPGGKVAIALPPDHPFLPNAVLVVWTSYGQAYPDGQGDIYTTVLLNGTQPVGYDMLVNWEFVVGDQSGGTIEVLKNGNVVFAWQSYNQATPIPPYQVGYDPFATVWTPRLDPFVYNLNIATECDENIPCGGFDVVGNPMAEFLNISLKLSSSIVSWSAPNITTLNSGSVTPSYDPTTRTITWVGNPVAVNRSLKDLVLTTQPDFIGNVEMPVTSVDPNGVYPDFTGTLSIQVNQVDYAPDLTVNPISVDQGTPFILTPAMFSASNRDHNVANNSTYINSMIYTIGLPLHVIFSNTRTGQQILSYTGEEAMAGAIQGMPDDSGVVSSWTVTATQTGQADKLGQSLSSATLPANIIFTPRPTVTIAPLDVKSDQIFIFTTQSLNATTHGASQNGSYWELSNIRNSQIVNVAKGEPLSVAASGTVVFSPQAVALGQIGLKSDGSTNSPGFDARYCIQATSFKGSLCSSQPVSAGINFNYVAPTNTAVAAAVTVPTAALLLTGLGIFGAYRYRRSKQLEEQRANYPLANAIYHELKIPGTEDFQSEKGIAFTNAVDSLNNELIRADVDIKQMVAEEIIELAHKLANATKAQLSKKINPLDIQDYAQSIVATAMTLTGKNKTDDAGVELSTVANSKDIRVSTSKIDTLVEPLLTSEERAQLTV